MQVCHTLKNKAKTVLVLKEPSTPTEMCCCTDGFVQEKGFTDIKNVRKKCLLGSCYVVTKVFHVACAIRLLCLGGCLQEKNENNQIQVSVILWSIFIVCPLSVRVFKKFVLSRSLSFPATPAA